MGIGAIGIPTLPSPQASAFAGMQKAQAQVDEAGAQLAAGSTDPAVAVGLKVAETQFAVGATLMKADQDNTKRLMDILA